MQRRAQPIEQDDDIQKAQEAAEEQRRLAAQETATDLTTDLTAVYGRRGFSVFGGP